jgi:hypothetical protein
MFLLMYSPAAAYILGGFQQSLKVIIVNGSMNKSTCTVVPTVLVPLIKTAISPLG